jgi:glutamyl-tRNA synthetase
LGKRTIQVNGDILVSGSDADEMREGEVIRLLGLGVVRIKNLANQIDAELEDDSTPTEKKIQWVAENDAVQIKIIIPNQLFIDEQFNEDSLMTVEAITESAYLNLKDDAEIQFVRLGYYRKESLHQVIFTHK